MFKNFKNFFLLFLIFNFIFQNECKIQKNICKCRNNISNKVIGGKIAKSNSFPWQISLGILPDTPWEIRPDKYVKTSREKVPSKIKMATHICGGAIINENYILTAAHCVTDENLNIKPFQNYGVGFGNNHDLVDIYNNGRVQIEKIYVNPDYNISLIDTENDIAILKLSQPINVETKSVQPACFMKEKHNIKKIYNEVVASGWGSVNKMQLNYLTGSWIGYEPSQKLKEATFFDVSNNSTICEEKPKLICIRPIIEEESVCKGDSGGPLHYTAYGKTFVIGVTSFGTSKRIGPFTMIACDGDASYTRVSSTMDWIQSIIGDDLCLFEEVSYEKIHLVNS